MTKKRKSRRSAVKYPALKPEYNLRSRFELIDYDYINQLTAEEKEWLNSFTEEYVNANFNHDGVKIHDKEKYKKQAYDSNNARNRCILTRCKASGTITDFEHLSQKEKKNLGIHDEIEERDISEILDDIDNAQNNTDNKR